MIDANMLNKGALPMGIATTWIVTKILTRRHPLEISCFTRSPARSFSLFFYGVFFAGLANVRKLVEDESFTKDYGFKRIVEANRRTQASIENVRHKLDVSTSSIQTRSEI